MGLIQKLLGGIFSFLGSLFSPFIKLLGLSKKSEYFMELDEAKAETPAVSTSSAKATPDKAEAVKAKLDSAPAKAQPVKAETAAPAPAKAQPVKAEATKPAKVEASQPAKAEATTATAPKPEAPEPSQPAASTFAPDYLIQPSSQNGRRRPGPTMGYFLNMAKQVKTPSQAA